MDQTRIAVLTECIREMINKEREVAPIITRCHDAIEDAINEVVPEADTEMVVEKYKVQHINKAILVWCVNGLYNDNIIILTTYYNNNTSYLKQTGDVPPGDFNFGDMNDPKSLLDQDALENTRPTNRNLYPKKKELEAQILSTSEDLAKSKISVELTVVISLTPFALYLTCGLYIQ